jgi:cytochrome c-type biogenesis protein CcmH/NrfG
MGLARAREARWEEAAAGFAAAVRVVPGFAEGHANLGNVRLQQRRMEEAIAHYQEALRLRPDLPGIEENLALARTAAGRP